MPPELVKAHQGLDKAIEAAYGRTFPALFYLYQALA
jgi:hypothetical protein